MNPIEVDQAIGMVRGHAWIPLASLFINICVRLSKSDAAVAWCPLNWRPKVRPYAALGLGVASGVVAGLAGGSWFSTLTGGLVAGMLAITTHDVVVESMRNGRDIGVKKLPPAPSMFEGVS